LEETEQRQQGQWKEVTKTLADIAAQVQKQSPSADIKPAIKHFKKQLPKGAPLIPATLKRLLQQLSDMQQQAMSDSPKSSSGLFGKLFGNEEQKEGQSDGQSEKQQQASPQSGASATEDAEWEEIDDGDMSIEGEIIGEEIEAKAYDRERALPEAVLKETYQEQSSPEVPDRVSIILVELLDHFKTVPASERKASKARKRIEQGLKWFELAPTLEDIRDFVLQAYIGADNDYRAYLERLYGELTDILGALGVSIETEQRVREAAEQLHSGVSGSMSAVSQALSGDTNIDELKHAVEGHMQQLQQALTNYKQQSSTPSDSESLAVQLQALASKVQQMEQNEEDIRHRLEEEKQRAVTDSLTGLPNREAYGEKVYEEVQRWQRYEHPLSLAVLDIDFFKKINDNYGHQTGDKVLKIVSSAVAKRLREVDFMARFGGEEFVLLLPETNADNALAMLNRIREALANAPFRYKDEKITITVSIGISEFKEGDDSETVFARADQALYDAKESGRNKCCVG
jgi:diguanylate cyclase